MELNPFPKTTLLLWRQRVCLLALLPTVAFSILSFLSLWFLLPLGLALLCAFFVLFWYLPRYIKSYTVRLPDGAVIMERGVFIRTTHIMPFSRLLYAQSVSSPLAKRMGLAALRLKAARSSVLIPELESRDIEAFLRAVSGEAPYEP